MGDYPDYTEVMQIIGSDIMVPIDLQAAYVMMPVDIQAQYVTLDIKITAQTVTLDINLKSSDITLNVDITAQTVGNINIDIDAQSVGIQLQPDWQSVAGNYKGVTIQGTNLAVGGYGDNDYTVPTGKTLYVWITTCRCKANAAADRNNNQMCSVVVGGIGKGGNGGASLVLPVPLKFTEGQTCTITFNNYANHALDYTADWRGYEI